MCPPFSASILPAVSGEAHNTRRLCMSKLGSRVVMAEAPERELHTTMDCGIPRSLTSASNGNRLGRTMRSFLMEVNADE